MTDWLTRAEAAQLCRVSERTFDRWVHLGRVPKHLTAGGRPRFNRADVEAACARPDPSQPGPPEPARL